MDAKQKAIEAARKYADDPSDENAWVLFETIAFVTPVCTPVCTAASWIVDWPTATEPITVSTDAPLAEPKCECHERDGTFVCKYCYAQGYRGHMQ
jgi:hypothetical protein